MMETHDIIKKEKEPQPQDKVVARMAYKGKSLRIDVTTDGLESVDEEVLGRELAESMKTLYQEGEK